MAPQRATLPLLAFQHHVGSLYIDPAQLEFVAELGVGELALVERGRWYPADGAPQDVVVKGYKPCVIAAPEDFRELLLEASKLQRLQHPNMTHFLGLGCFECGTLAQVRGSIFVVEQYAGMRCLKKLISEQMRVRVKNLYSMRAALNWMLQVASALAALHGEAPPYIHGDVKPDNVFLSDGSTNSATAKLGDLKPHRYIYDKAASTLSRYLHSTASTHGAHHYSGLQGSPPELQQSSLAKHSAAYGGSAWSEGGLHNQQQEQQSEGPQQQQQQLALLQHGVSADGSPMPAAGMSPPAAVAVAVATGADPAEDARGRLSPAEASALQQAAASRPLAITGEYRRSRTWTAASGSPAGSGSGGGGGGEGARGVLSDSAHDTNGPLSDTLPPRHQHQQQLLEQGPVMQVKRSSAVAVPPAKRSHVHHHQHLHHSFQQQEQQASLSLGSVVSSRSLPFDDPSRIPWQDLTGPLQQQQQHAQQQLQLQLQLQHQSSGLSDSANSTHKLSASLKGLLKSAGRLLGQEQQPGKRLLYSELAAASSPDQDVLMEARSLEEGKVHGQQFFSMGRGSSQDLLGCHLATDSDTPCGSAAAVPPLLDDGSAHSSAAASTLTSPGGSWLQQVLASNRSAHGGNSTITLVPKQQQPPQQQPLQHGSGSMPEEAGSICSSSHAPSKHTSSSAGGGAAGGGGGAAAGCGWDLTATGAANPQGLAQSALLDLFADLVDEPQVPSWGSLEPAGSISIISPGTCVQRIWHQRTTPAAAAPPPCFPIQVAAAAAGTGNGPLGNGAPCVVSEGPPATRGAAVMPCDLSVAERGPGTGALHLPTPFSSLSNTAFESCQTPSSKAADRSNQEAVDVASNAAAVARSGVPGLLEAKQHGGSSAFLALTAIDSIREESASEWGSSHGGHSASGDPSSPAGSHSPSSPAKAGTHPSRTVSGSGAALPAPPAAAPRQGSGQVAAQAPPPSLPAAAASSEQGGVPLLWFMKDTRSARDTQRNGDPLDNSSHSKGTLTRSGSSELPSALTEPAADASSADAPTAAAVPRSPLSKSSPRGLFDGSAAPQAVPPLDYACSRSLSAPLSSSQAASAAYAAAAGSPPGKGGVSGVLKGGAAGGSVRGGKHVRFAVARAAGATASRDRGLIYTAPELMQGQRPTVKVDVFAFGVMLYELLSRSLIIIADASGDCTHHSNGSACSSPWDEGPRALLAYAQKVAEGYRPPLLRHWPPAVQQLISSCWAAEPSERPSMDAVVVQLKALLEDKATVRELDGFVLALSDMEVNATCQCSCTIS